MVEAFHTFEGAPRSMFITASMLAFADFEKSFLLKTDASKQALGAVRFTRNKWMVATTQYLAVAAKHSMLMSESYHSSKLEFLALKWAITKHFQEPLPWKPFIVWTDNNPLTYIITTLNLDTTRYTVGLSHSPNTPLILNTRRDMITLCLMFWVGSQQDSMLKWLNQSSMVSIWKQLDMSRNPWQLSDQSWRWDRQADPGKSGVSSSHMTKSRATCYRLGGCPEGRSHAMIHPGLDH